MRNTLLKSGAAARGHFRSRASAKIYDAEVFSAPPSELERLLKENNGDSFFTLPEWFAAVTACGPVAQTRAGLVTNSDCSSGLPFLLEGSSTLRSCTNLYTCEFDVVGSGEPADVRRLAEEMVRLPDFSAYFHLEGLNPELPTFSALRDGYRAAGWVVKGYRGWATWYEPVQNLSFERYLEQRPSVLRATWRRKLKALEKTQGFEIDVLPCGEDPELYIVAYEAVERESWKDRESYPDFIRNLIRLAARKGALRMGILSIGDTPAAAQFWLVWNGKAVIFKLAYAKRFSGFSPGTVLTMHMMRLILNGDRVNEVSFGRGNDAYKRLWAGSRRDYWGIEAANPRRVRGLLPSLRLGAGLLRDSLKGSHV
jgi:hypothetical protein